jgi:hypothetical protein
MYMMIQVDPVHEDVLIETIMVMKGGVAGCPRWIFRNLLALMCEFGCIPIIRSSCFMPQRYMSDSATHLCQAYKLENPWHTWSTFSLDLIQKFEGNVQRDKNCELLTLKQSGTVEEYKRQFDKLVYQIRLYDPNMGGLMLVQRFILGLKEELRAIVKV